MINKVIDNGSTYSVSENGVVKIIPKTADNKDYLRVQEWLQENSLTEKTALEVAQERDQRAKETRDKYIDSPISYDGSLWDADELARERMKDAIRLAGRKNTPNATRTWKLADNTPRSGVTIADLNAVLDAHTERMDDAFTQYLTWAAGGMASEFEIS